MDDSPAAPKFFDRFYSSSDEDDDFSSLNVGCGGGGGVEDATKRLDHMMQFLDGRLSSANTDDHSKARGGGLLEFVGAGGGVGIFKLPLRGAVHPTRPASLELRPHPFRESQVGCSLRTIASSDSQLWAGQDCGLRFWNFSDLYGAGPAEDAPPFSESVPTPPALCLVTDAGNRLVLSGHRDGKIRVWKMVNDRSASSYGNGTASNGHFGEILAWHAHRAPVLSMLTTSRGDLWSASEGGIIKVWPWEAIEKSLSVPVEKRHMAALTVERSYIDLKSQVTSNGICQMFASDVRYMLSDHSRAKVWTAGYLSIALWDALTRELLKVFNIDGQIENGVDMLSGQDPAIEDDVKMKFSFASKKEKQQGSFNFFQRSRNAIIGAADAVRRAAAKGTFGDDNRKIEALVSMIDGTIWTGCSNGLLVQWDGSGNRIQEFHYYPSAVHCFCMTGSHLWVGYANGTVQVLNREGKELGGWVAHNSPVIKMAVGAGYVFSLANHGGIRGWNVMSPGYVDTVLRSELANKEFLYTKMENLKILTGTWNVGQERASHDSLISWLGSAASDVDIVVVGLQEVEMGAGFLAMSAAKETVGIEGSSAGQWWLDVIGKILNEGSPFERIGSRQLAGLLIVVWVRTNLRAYVGDVEAAAVPCGFGRAIGNKGAVGLKMRVYDRILCFVNCHFAAHLEAVIRRNADFDHVYRTMTFSRSTNMLSAAAVGVSSSVQMLHSTNTLGGHNVEQMPELSEADMIVFLGDFNYRLHDISYDEARDFVSQRSFDWLRERDQLRAEMQAGNVFQGMREAVIRFPPTYKFEKHQVGLAGYDSGEKKRIPAWCDRILYRDSRSNLKSECSLQSPVVSSVLQYDACMDATDSDHKPVRCIFNVNIARVDEYMRRREFGDIISSNKKIRFKHEEICKVPETIVSTNNIILQKQDTSVLRITNKSGKNEALFKIICEGQSTIGEDGQASNHLPRGSFGFPPWLEVRPAAGIIGPNHIVEVSVRHEEFQTFEEFVDGVPRNWWCEDNRDKEMILVVKVFGSYMIQTREHRIRVRQCLLSKSTNVDSRPSNPKRTQENVLYRSDFQHLSCSYDVVDHLRNLQNL